MQRRPRASALYSLPRWPLPCDAFDQPGNIKSTCFIFEYTEEGRHLALTVSTQGGPWWLKDAPWVFVSYFSFRPGSDPGKDWGHGSCFHTLNTFRRGQAGGGDICTAGTFLSLKSRCASQLNWNNLFLRETEKPYLFSNASLLASKSVPGLHARGGLARYILVSPPTTSN